ncbi:translation initiation factor IF-2-like [Myiozetetes cayanensis]|uniref:translation initiation factor IF-2-like n=1 Tax=Myiozetetes cayanensis TaxID=478635 RepID=UPI00215EFCA9|nr:translation initiation factor IF-2-like [Myiozetetes cayanensis]
MPPQVVAAAPTGVRVAVPSGQPCTSRVYAGPAQAFPPRRDKDGAGSHRPPGQPCGRRCASARPCGPLGAAAPTLLQAQPPPRPRPRPRPRPVRARPPRAAPVRPDGAAPAHWAGGRRQGRSHFLPPCPSGSGVSGRRCGGTAASRAGPPLPPRPLHPARRRCHLRPRASPAWARVAGAPDSGCGTARERPGEIGRAQPGPARPGAAAAAGAAGARLCSRGSEGPPPGGGAAGRACEVGMGRGGSCPRRGRGAGPGSGQGGGRGLSRGRAQVGAGPNLARSLQRAVWDLPITMGTFPAPRVPLPPACPAPPPQGVGVRG